MQQRAKGQADLFGGDPGPPAGGERKSGPRAPLADRMRPASIEDFFGQEHLLAQGRLLRELIGGDRMPSLILWGPPGCGKTTLCHILARSIRAQFLQFSAVLSGVKELRAAIDEAKSHFRRTGERTLLFVDEIHRFNKAQQDAFLPYLEDGTVTLVGATTENPSFEIIGPLLSRVSVVTLRALGPEDLRRIVERAVADPVNGLGGSGVGIEPEALRFLVDSARGDARSALNTLEAAADLARRQGLSTITVPVIEESAQRRALAYDKSGEHHYNVISAFIKSLRGSDPDAAVYWMMRMLEAGEEPLFVARRMVIFAAEDVGNADPQALVLAVAARDAVHFVGLPEGRIPLAQAAVYLATAPKSNASYKAMLAAAADVSEHGALPVPLHLRNAPTALLEREGYGRGYRYPHDYDGHVVEQQYLPEALRERRYYQPSDQGREREIAERLRRWRHRPGSDPGDE